VPAAQVLNEAQVVAPAAANIPVAQFTQVAFVVGVPAAPAVVPAGQDTQALQLNAFSVEEYVPVAQSPQTRLVVVVPAVVMNLPGTQVVKLTHGVAAEPSSSQVPAMQATGALVPPLQKVPAVHGVQPGGVLTVPGVVS